MGESSCLLERWQFRFYSRVPNVSRYVLDTSYERYIITMDRNVNYFFGDFIRTMRLFTPYLESSIHLAGVSARVKDFHRLVVKRVFRSPDLATFDDFWIAYTYTFLSRLDA